jgi:hypothetical protein
MSDGLASNLGASSFGSRQDTIETLAMPTDSHGRLGCADFVVGLGHSFVELIDPTLNQEIDWLWFVFSQVGFGIVAGIVAGIIVSRQQRVPTRQQHLPFAVRAGFEVLARIDKKDGGNPR